MIEIKIPDANGLVKIKDYNAKITKIKGELPSTIGLAATDSFSTEQNKLPNVKDVVKRSRL